MPRTRRPPSKELPTGTELPVQHISEKGYSPPSISIPTQAEASKEEAKRSKQTRQAEREIIVTLRLPRELHARLRELGGERGLTAEIRRRLEASLAESPAGSKDPWFGDLLTAINHAAAGAAKLRPLPKGIPVKERYDAARWGPDTTAYETFAEAVQQLMRAFAPEGAPAVSQETGLRLADQLVGLALGALGERGIEAFANLPEIDREFMKHSGGTAQDFAEKAERRSEEEENDP